MQTQVDEAEEWPGFEECQRIRKAKCGGRKLRRTLEPSGGPAEAICSWWLRRRAHRPQPLCKGGNARYGRVPNRPASHSR
jgi:hypothetical protein